MLFPLFSSTIAICFVIYLFQDILKVSPGNARMQEIASYIREGSQAYLRKQYTSVFFFFFLIAFLLLLKAHFVDVYSPIGVLAYYAPFAFLSGGFFSAMAGYFGMNIATLSNVRTTQAVSKSLNSGLQVAFKSGTVMGLLVVGLGVLHISSWFLILGAWNIKSKELFIPISNILISSSLGASFMALFARIGGGIFTKAADVGADLVGKIEKDIPEDDPRNPAVIADNVGDNVGDVAGMGADLYESYVGSIISTMAIAPIAFISFDLYEIYFYSILPLIIAGIGILSSIIGSFFIRIKDSKDVKLLDLLWTLRRGIYGSSIIMFFFSIAVIIYFSPSRFLGTYGLGIPICILIGLMTGNILGYFTEYFTSFDYKPTLNLTEKAKTGAATIIISGIALGKRSTVIPVLTIAIATLLSYYSMEGSNNFYMGLYGIGMAAVGMLSTLGITLASDAYGPVADNAGGIAEMAQLPKEIRERTNLLDALGNTTAATGKGFAIGSAALTTLTLLSNYILVIQPILGGAYNSTYMSLTNPPVLMGLLIGVMIPFYFSSMMMDAVGNSAFSIVEEVRRQFRNPDISSGKVKPDYATCVKISTSSAQREMIKPALLAILSPIILGSILGLESLFSFLAGSLASGFVLAIMMANAGGAWDNAKKYIEKKEKGTPSHTASIIGDTVGDPFKDTAGPSINILIKLVSIISIIFANLIYLLYKLIH